MESYRSGHNGAHSKCVCPPGHEGSNPSDSAKRTGYQVFLITGSLYVICLFCSRADDRTSHSICYEVRDHSGRSDKTEIYGIVPFKSSHLSAIKSDTHIFIWLFTVRTPHVFLLAGEAGGIKTASAIILL